MYKKVDSEVVEGLREIVGADSVLVETEDMEPYSHDEFMERDSVLACERYLGKELPFHDAAAHLLIQLDGNHKEAIEADYDKVSDVCLENGALDVLVALDPRDENRLWEARRTIIDALKNESPINHIEDVVVPRAEISFEKTSVQLFGATVKGKLKGNMERFSCLIWMALKLQLRFSQIQGQAFHLSRAFYATLKPAHQVHQSTFYTIHTFQAHFLEPQQSNSLNPYISQRFLQLT